jgi:beta-lactam-binding protein with PASTA domain
MSTDTPLRTVPAVSGLSVPVALSILGGAGFTPGGSIEQASDLITAGFVLGTEPPEGEILPEGTRVDLVISTGHAPTGVVPDVSGMRFEDAAGALASDGYSSHSVEQSSSTIEAGIVIGTSPPAGASLHPGGHVAMIVSTGWGPVPPDPIPQPPDPIQEPPRILGPE